MTISAMLVLLIVIALAAAIGAVLAAFDRRAQAEADGNLRHAVVAQVEALLPQTQCAQCGYPGCHPYAEAIVDGDAPIDRCPPGGDTTIQALATLLGCEPGPLDPAFGSTRLPQLAVIDEANCIGCALCLPACPVDAIVGAHHYLHTVLSSQCTGCELCVAPCPTDCISLVPKPVTLEDWRWPRPDEGDRHAPQPNAP